MINSITGKITHKDSETIHVLAGGGIEWELVISRKSSGQLPDAGEVAKVYTYLVHREDSMRLFGFATSAERTLFLDLLKVDGVGPKGAMKILSGIDHERFVEALERSDASALAGVPGIGTKTAQKIILTLRGKLTLEHAPAVSTVEEDIVAALIGMGYDRKTARASVAAAAQSPDAVRLKGEELERELLTRAIAIASGREGKQ